MNWIEFGISFAAGLVLLILSVRAICLAVRQERRDCKRKVIERRFRCK